MIRTATDEDVERILDLGEEMQRDSVYQYISHNRSKAAKEVRWTIRNGCLPVLEINGRVEGFMMGYVRAPYFSDDVVGFEEILYIDPAHRAGRNAPRLIAYWIDWCVRHGAKYLKPGTACGDPAADRLYEAMGFTRSGSNFYKVVK